MNIKEKTVYYDKYSVKQPITSNEQRVKNAYAYNRSLMFCLLNDKTNIFTCDKIEDMNNIIDNGQNRVLVNFEINDTNCDMFYDFLRSLRETRKILIKNCSSEIIIENICEIAKFIPNLSTIRSSDSGYIYKCPDLEKKNLSIRSKKCKSVNK